MERQHLAGNERGEFSMLDFSHLLRRSRGVCQQDAGVPSFIHIFVCLFIFFICVYLWTKFFL